ncbi:MAG: aquaporin [Chloroflexi bacterium]|nr:aquaporin [Chloroflexota bacterium]
MGPLSGLDMRQFAAEFIGAFVLIFAGAGSIILFAGNAAGVVVIALAHGLAIAVMVSTLGHISGGLFNPALTVGLWVTRRLGTLTTVGFVLAQLAGAAVAAWALLVLFPEAQREAVNLGVPELGPATSFAQGVGLEAVMTLILMLVVFGTAIDGRGPKLGGFAIGLTITLDIFFGGPLTGAAMNPARAFGPALAQLSWDSHLVYWVGPVIGAVAGALIYHYLFMPEEEEVAASA